MQNRWCIDSQQGLQNASVVELSGVTAIRELEKAEEVSEMVTPAVVLIVRWTLFARVRSAYQEM